MQRFPENYLQFLTLFHCDRDYFECHEVLEAEWKKDPKAKRKTYWTGLIQIAVTLYHHRRENFTGAKKMIAKAQQNIKPNRVPLERLGLHYEQLCQVLDACRLRIEKHDAYVSVNLPIKDPDLLQCCKQRCRTAGKHWGNKSNLSDTFLVQKHKARRNH